MENEKQSRLRPGDPGYDEAQALERTVRIVRKAQGKKNPGDFAYGSPEHQAAEEEYLRDLLRAMGEDPDEPESAS
ncbi:hypothetical protein ABWH74_001290 [Burkholderia vietnamiensis]|uniref:hypothetical protein n=1 Tax=Burkholderia cepacia complex TaxID=87882 RepID=UPI0009B5EB17|nr:MULTISPECIES: hypothetical protein [Burkholderia cepacia complex]TPQ45791.1 hypothetical protein C2U71_11005 [Burkholderia ubonensis]MBJ9656642.1 hypothetical protein [Burkholderia multivorans]MBR7922713.1 hypothetical protein [Burkholderia multivorans]MBU9440321.1 hypothetical protein [Burkholderia multivorans]MBU9473855.1 hypothetical protein [Burkholderia multivorans]